MQQLTVAAGLCLNTHRGVICFYKDRSNSCCFSAALSSSLPPAIPPLLPHPLLAAAALADTNPFQANPSIHLRRQTLNPKP